MKDQSIKNFNFFEIRVLLIELLNKSNLNGLVDASFFSKEVHDFGIL